MDMVKQFEEHLMEIGIAPKTIESYAGDVKMFCEYLEQQGMMDWTQLRRIYFVSYKNKLVEEGYAIPTINKKVNSLQAFNRFLIHKGLLTEQMIVLGRDRVKVAAGSEKEVEVLAEEEIQRLLAYVKDRSKVTLRNCLIIHLLLYTGVRVSELCRIKLKDMDFLA